MATRPERPIIVSVEDDRGYQILRSIRQIVQQVSLHSRQLARETGLTVPQLLCLRAIAVAEVPANTLSAIAAAVQLSKPTASGVVERLVRAGLVERNRSERDRRRIALSITDAGRAKLEAAPRPLQDRFLRRIEALDADEREQILGALGRVVELMGADELEATAPVLAMPPR